MKRTKIGFVTLGLCLISLGAGLLLPLFTDLAFWDILRFWPVILISLGLELIFHLLFSRDKDERLHFSAGSIVSLVFILLFCAAVSGIAQFSNSLDIPWNDIFWSDNLDYNGSGAESDSLTQTFSFASSEIDLDLSAVDLTVVPSTDGKASAEIRAISRRSSLSAETVMAAVDIDDDSLSIQSRPSGAYYEITIYLPDDASVTLEAAASRIDFFDLKAELDLDVSASELSLQNIQGNISLDAAASQLTLEELVGDLSLDVAAGSVSLVSLDGVLDANLQAGDYNISPVHPIHKGSKIDISEGALQFDVPEVPGGAIDLSGTATAVDYDGDGDLIQQSELSVSMKAPSGEETVLTIDSRNAYLDLSGLDYLK